jgi:hypothetical protein
MSIEGDIPTFPALPALITHHSKLTLPKTSFGNVVLTSCKYFIIDFSFRDYLTVIGKLRRTGYTLLRRYKYYYEKSHDYWGRCPGKRHQRCAGKG